LTLAIDPFHERVATIALAVAEKYGFVLGGGLALIAHGAVSRPTRDIDLFGPESASVVDAAAAVCSALRAAGIRCENVPYESTLSQLIDGMDDHMVEMVAYQSDADEGVALSLGRLERSRSPVLLEIGPVMDMRDLIAYKVAALVTRAEVRDFVDVAVFLAEQSPRELLALARRVDPALEDEDVVAVGRRLDRTPDRAFEPYRLGADAVAVLRERFLDWPR
jgi:nucleotidyltransferase AbiEii toxin of type IV toxin-antitoxin system